LFERPRPVDGVRTNSPAFKRGQMAAGAEHGAEVAGDGPDVRAARAGDVDVDVEQITGRPDAKQVEAPHSDGPGLQLRSRSCPGQVIGALAVHLDRADFRRYLLDLPGQPDNRGTQRLGGYIARPNRPVG